MKLLKVLCVVCFQENISFRITLSEVLMFVPLYHRLSLPQRSRSVSTNCPTNIIFLHTARYYIRMIQTTPIRNKDSILFGGAFLSAKCLDYGEYQLVKEMDFSFCCSKQWAEILAKLNTLLSLQKITLAHCSLTANQTLLMRFINCTNLNLWDNQIDDAGLRQFHRMTQLKKLKIGKNRITDRGASYLTKNGKLMELNLAHNKISNEGVRILAKLTNLQYLDVNQTQTTIAILYFIVRMSKLKQITINRFPDYNKSLFYFRLQEGHIRKKIAFGN